MIVVLPFCNKDWADMERLIAWMLVLDKTVPYDCLLAFDDATPVGAVDRVHAQAKQYFKRVEHFSYMPPPVKGWPAAPNWAWQSVARYMYEHQNLVSWFWVESDAIPLKSGWLTKLHSEYVKGKKPFAGHVVETMGHMNGVGIYPTDVMGRSEKAMLARAAAWDVVLKEPTEHNVTPLNDWMQHCWNIGPNDIMWNGDGHPISFKSQDDLKKFLDFNCYLFHRCKDGSLIEQLKIWRANEVLVEKKKTVAIETNVPQFAKIVAPLQTDTSVPWKVETLIVSYHKDIEWLKYCLRAFNRFCVGFSGVTVAYPILEEDLFAPVLLQFGAKPHPFAEKKSKGMLNHMAIMASADTIVPPGTNFVMHIDSDCIYKEPTTPADYFVGGKPVYLKRTYASLKDDKGIVSDCAQWQMPTAKQLGFPVEWYTMCRHPTVLPISFYKDYRAHIESVHDRHFMDYMLSGKNSFPQDRMDWTAMGAYAHEKRFDEFHWIDIGVNPAPLDRQKTFWSHGGVKTYQAELDAILSKYCPTVEEEERMAQ